MRCFLLILDADAVAPDGQDLVQGLAGATTPSLDALAASGRVGAAETAAGGHPSSGRGLLTLLGCKGGEVARVTPPVLEAAALGVPLGPDDWVMRLGLVGLSTDDEGPHFGEADPSPEEANALFADLFAAWSQACPEHASGVEIVGSGPSRLLVDRSRTWYDGVETIPPSRAAGEDWVDCLPDGGPIAASDRLCALISVSRHALAEHPVNRARLEQGLTPANAAWLWEPGCAGGLAGSRRDADLAAFADGPEAIGAFRLVGLEPAPAGPLESLASRLLGSAAGLTIAFVSAPIETVDRVVLAPLVDGLGGLGDEQAPWRILVAVSHDPGGGLAPFALAGGWVRTLVPRRLHEGPWSDLRVNPGSDLLEYAMYSGRRDAAPRARRRRPRGEP